VWWTGTPKDRDKVRSLGSSIFSKFKTSTVVGKKERRRGGTNKKPHHRWRLVVY
jgi:hypothetical protein